MTADFMRRMARDVRTTLSNGLRGEWDALGNLYKALYKGGHLYQVGVESHMQDQLLDICDRAAVGVLKKSLFTAPNHRCLYFRVEAMKFVVHFIDKSYTDNFDNDHERGEINVVRVYSELDMDCIEKSWGITDAKHMSTKANLITDVFTDETEHSQTVGDGYVVVHRPTVRKFVQDCNGQRAFCFFHPVISTDTMEYNLDEGPIYCALHTIEFVLNEYKNQIK